MKAKHPGWSRWQLRCCLYWQPKAKKQLRQKVEAFLEEHPGCIAVYTPEAYGVDVTAAMASIGIDLEWPPERFAYQVALVGTPVAPNQGH